jgi:hypothetical protein
VPDTRGEFNGGLSRTVTRSQVTDRGLLDHAHTSSLNSVAALMKNQSRVGGAAEGALAGLVDQEERWRRRPIISSERASHAHCARPTSVCPGRSDRTSKTCSIGNAGQTQAGVPQFVGISRDSRRRFPCKLTG